MSRPNGIYIKRGSRVLGPFSVKQQRRLYGLGQITDDDLASPNKIGPWIQFRQFNGDDQEEAEATVSPPPVKQSQPNPQPVKRSQPKAPRVLSEDLDEFVEQTQRARSQPKFGKHDCFQCGHSFARFISACPQCGTRRPKRLMRDADDAGTEDNELASLTEAVAMAEKLPSLPPRRKKKKADKRTNRNRDTTRLGIWHLIKEVVSQNSSLLYPVMMLTIVIAGVAGMVQFLNFTAKVKTGISGREQKEFMKKTTAKWIELEKIHEARNSEVLWRDNRWMPLSQVLGVDWAALPDWFDALQHPVAHNLAESILQKWSAAEGYPYPEDLIAGLKSPNQRVQYWSIVIIKRLQHQQDKDARISELERFRDGDNKQLADAAVQTLQAIRPGPVNGGSPSTAGNPVAPASGDQTVKMPDTASGQQTHTLIGYTRNGNYFAFSADGKRLASANMDGKVMMWETTSGQKLLTFNGHSKPALSVAFSPDGKRLASGSVDQTVKVWDTTSGQETLTLRGHTGHVRSVAFSPDGKRLASASQDGTVKVWDAMSGQKTRSFGADSIAGNRVAFSPDGKRLVSGGYDQTVKVWDAVSGQETLTLSGLTDTVECVAFSADGNRLASAEYNGTVRVWDATSGQETLTLKGHTGPVMCVAFSADGRRLTSAGGTGDNTMKVWDATSGEVSHTFSEPDHFFMSVAFSADGKRLASVITGGTMKVWNVAPRAE